MHEDMQVLFTRKFMHSLINEILLFISLIYIYKKKKNYINKKKEILF